MISKKILSRYGYADLILGFSFILLSWRYLAIQNIWVHPHYYWDILPQTMANGTSIKLRDFADVLQPRQNFEVRTRFGNYLIMAMDQKMRYSLLQHIYLPPNFSPILFIFNGIVSPIMFYKINKSIFSDTRVAKISLALFLNTIGYYSLTSNMFMAAKPIGMTIILVSLFLAIAIFRENFPRRKVFYTVILICVVYFGLFVDEIVFVLLLIPYFLLIFLSKLDKTNIRNKIIRIIQANFGTGFAFVLWILTITFIIPKVVFSLFDWKFDFWGFNLNLKNDINFGGAYEQGTNVDIVFILNAFISNITNISFFHLIPHWFFTPNLSVSYGNPNSLYRFGAIPIVLQILIVVTLLTIFKLCYKGRYYEMFTFLGAYIFSILFTSLLQLKHVPEISTYVYGSSIAIFSTLLITSTIRMLIMSEKKSLVIIFTFFILMISTLNSYEFNKRWDVFHRNWSIMNVKNFTSQSKNENLNYLVKTSTDIEPFLFENYRIWHSYHNKKLNSYLEKNQISLQGWSLVAELRLGDAASKLNDGDYHCSILNIKLECLGYKSD